MNENKKNEQIKGMRMLCEGGAWIKKPSVNQILDEIELYKSHTDFSEEISLNGLKAGLYILEFNTDKYTLKMNRMLWSG